MGGSLGKKQEHGTVKGGEEAPNLPLPGTSKAEGTSLNLGKILKPKNSTSEFGLTDIASNITHRFSVLSGLSFISYVSMPPTDRNKRPWSRLSRKRWHPNTLQNEYAQCKAVWPVAQTEAMFLPEFPIGIEDKMKLIFISELSRGAFGQVFHVRCASTHREYAMKVLSKSQVCSLDAVDQVKQEVKIQHICSHHPFITPLKHFWQTRKLLIVMTEYVGYGELHQLWRSLGHLPENLLSIFVAEIAIALDFLHNAGIIYRDLKMENILLDVEGHIKLIDFGLSRWLTYGCKTKTICGTLQFMAPEILKGEEYGHSADWWSLGIIAYSLFIGHYPVSGFDNHVSMCNAVEKFAYIPPEECSRGLKSLIFGLLERNPEQRIHNLYKLEKEEIFLDLDFDDVRDKKVSPRTILEEHIERKSRHNFEDFSGLTSTPKKTVSSIGMSMGSCAPPPSDRSSSLLHKPNYCNSPLGIRRHIPWDRSRRSSSSPLLNSPLIHPGRLGHHDALIKSVSSTGYNGAAVPLLQSPLLRLAHGQGRHTARSKWTQRAVSASALPTAVSPMLVNVRGNRRERWKVGNGKHMKERSGVPPFIRRDSFSPVHSDSSSSDIVSGMNGMYKKKCNSDECIRQENKRNSVEPIKMRRSKLDPDTPMCSPCPNTNVKSFNFNHKKMDILENKVDLSESLTPLCDNFLENVDNLKDEFFNDLVTSTPKKESAMNKVCSVRQSYRKAINSPTQINKCDLINGAWLGNDNCSPLGEEDFEDSLESFPWISESIDTCT